MTEEKDGPVVVRQIRIDATPAAVYSLLTDARLMTAWFAEVVVAEPFSGGTFRITEPGGRVIEGKYLEVVPNRKVVFSWGGIEGLKPGETIVDITLEPDGDGTLVTLRHRGLPPQVFEAHDKGWKNSGLPKLKAVAEGRDPGGLCLATPK